MTRNVGMNFETYTREVAPKTGEENVQNTKKSSTSEASKALQKYFGKSAAEAAKQVKSAKPADETQAKKSFEKAKKRLEAESAKQVKNEVKIKKTVKATNGKTYFDADVAKRKVEGKYYVLDSYALEKKPEAFWKSVMTPEDFKIWKEAEDAQREIKEKHPALKEPNMIMGKEAQDTYSKYQEEVAKASGVDIMPNEKLIKDIESHREIK